MKKSRIILRANAFYRNKAETIYSDEWKLKDAKELLEDGTFKRMPDERRTGLSDGKNEKRTGEIP